MKKKVLFVVDIPDWAFHHMIKEVMGKFNDEYDFYWDFSSLFLKGRTAYKVNTAKALLYNAINFTKYLVSKTNLFKNINVVHFLSLKRNRISSCISDRANNFWFENRFYNRKILSYNKSYDIIFHMDYYYQYSCSKLPHQVKDNNFIVGIYTEGFPHNGTNYDYNLEKDIKNITQKDFFEQYINTYKALVVGSGNLQQQYASYNIPTYLCNAVYRESDFFVSNDKKFFDDYLIIGWTGNPAREFKGFDTIIKPAIEKVKSTGRKVVLKTKFSGTYDELIKFYDDIALCLIASNADTGPSLFVEASLSGIPCISTKVGFPDMVIENNKNGFIVERDIDAFFEKICFCYDNRDALYEFSKRIKNDYLRILGNDVLIHNWRNVIETTTSL
jgi:glycosyltransferase involved in cell wall biosynthesis